MFYQFTSWIHIRLLLCDPSFIKNSGCMLNPTVQIVILSRPNPTTLFILLETNTMICLPALLDHYPSLDRFVKHLKLRVRISNIRRYRNGLILAHRGCHLTHLYSSSFVSGQSIKSLSSDPL